MDDIIEEMRKAAATASRIRKPARSIVEIELAAGEAVWSELREGGAPAGEAVRAVVNLQIIY